MGMLGGGEGSNTQRIKKLEAEFESLSQSGGKSATNSQKILNIQAQLNEIKN